VPTMADGDGASVEEQTVLLKTPDVEQGQSVRIIAASFPYT